MKGDWSIIGLILFTKVCIFLLIFLSYSFFPFNLSYYLPNFIYPKGEKVTLQTAYKTWDAQHFLYLSEKGYRPNSDSNAFAPLYPLSISLVNIVIRNSFISGLLISNIASLFGWYLFYLLISKWFDAKTAYKSLLFFLCFPTTFYFSLIYSESLFFLFCMLFFYFLAKKNIPLASLIAFFIPTIRLIGIAIIVPFIVWYIFDLHKKNIHQEVVDIAQVFLKKHAVFLLSPVLGLAVVMIFMWVSTGNAFAQFDAQKYFISHYSFFALFNPLFFITSFFHFPLAIHGFTNSLFDRSFFVLFLIALGYMAKRVSPALFVFSILFGILPVMSGSFMSYMRYLTVIFPLFILLGRLTQEKKYAFLEFPLLFVFVLLQTLFVIMHSLNYWVA